VKSFGLLKTNVNLTSNIKIIIDSEQNLYLESIDSDSFLSLSKLKKFKYNHNISLGKNISIFFQNIPNDIIFKSRKANLSLLSNDYSDQTDNIYEYGCKSISNNKDYTEKFEYFAPLYLNNSIPTNFFIFRVDGSEYENINKDNFLEKVISNFKVVKNFKLNERNIKDFFDNNYLKNTYFPKTQLDVSFKELELSYWYGIDINTGIYTNKSFMLSNYLENEKEIYELEKYITSKYKEYGLIFPNILNLSFLFNDYPSTPDERKNWSLNKYYGFYIDDMILVDSITTFKPKDLKNDIIIQSGNKLLSITDGYPFLEKWDDTIPFYIEHDGAFYLVKKRTLNNKIVLGKENRENYISEEYQYLSEDEYFIISDIDLNGKENELNKKTIKIDPNGNILNINNTPYDLDISDADIWVIEIDNEFYSLKKEKNILKINSDNSFEFNSNFYRIKNSGTWKRKDVKIDFNNKPLSFKIFKLKISDIKYFDNRIIRTDLSNFEYEINNDITETNEPKLYMEDYNSLGFPKEIEKFTFKDKETFIPVSSEYTANLETFKIINNKLSDIWQPNSDYCRWGYSNSLNMYDYPYTINNSFLLEEYNRSVSLDNSIPNRIDRNLDYFYMLNTNKHIYDFNTLDINIEKFDIETYIKSDYDYFKNFFEGTELLNNNLFNYKKYSIINKKDLETNNTLFRGLKFKFYNTLNNSNSIGLTNTNTFENYKFSILLSNKKESKLKWNILQEWQLNIHYKQGQKVIFNDIIYECVEDNIKINPSTLIGDIQVKTSPYNQSEWIPINQKNIFWTPNNSISYNNNDIIFNSDNYYFCIDSDNLIDFWNPYKTYNESEKVIFKERNYISLIDDNIYSPDMGFEKYWKKIQDENSKWKKIEVWSFDKRYNINTYVYYISSVYISKTNTEINQSPDTSAWEEVYSLIPNKDKIYTNQDNNIILHNNNYYMIEENPDNETLNNGIEIYINKKWKNILIFINISDNTLESYNIKRDKLYNSLYTKLTGLNFINSINNINLENGWINKIKYIIIDENEILESDINTLTNLKYLIQCDFPEEIQMNPHQIVKNVANFIPSVEVKNKLNNNRIDKINQIEHYTNIPIAYNILKQKDNIYDLNKVIIYRYSGSYSPVFLDVNLFKNNNLKFNTELNDFGILKEYKITKVNKIDSILKLKNSKENISIYPMIDEFGIAVVDWFIFKTTYSDDFLYSINK
jgi:hypothetical protein